MNNNITLKVMTSIRPPKKRNKIGNALTILTKKKKKEDSKVKMRNRKQYN